MPWSSRGGNCERYPPPFIVTPAILNLIVEVGELPGHWSADSGRSYPLLRKENRIRTILASLAISGQSFDKRFVAVAESYRHPSAYRVYAGKYGHCFGRRCATKCSTLRQMSLHLPYFYTISNSIDVLFSAFRYSSAIPLSVITQLIFSIVRT